MMSLGVLARMATVLTEALGAFHQLLGENDGRVTLN